MLPVQNLTTGHREIYADPENQELQERKCADALKR